METATIFGIALVTCWFSFGVQFSCYVWYRKHHHPILKMHKSVVNYHSGMIGDAILMPMVNVFCGSILQLSGWPWPTSLEVVVSMIMGILITFAFHYGQYYYHLTNWTMPENGRWNKLGLYHALFMFCESSFLSYTLIKAIQLVSEKGFATVSQPFVMAWMVLAVFLITFMYDYWKLLFLKLLKRQSLARGRTS